MNACRLKMDFAGPIFYACGALDPHQAVCLPGHDTQFRVPVIGTAVATQRWRHSHPDNWWRPRAKGWNSGPALPRRLPSEVEDLVKKMTADRLSIDFVHCGLEFLIGEMDRSSNRIAVGLIVAALMIGSSLIILAGTGPTLWGLPVFGLVGFATAFILGSSAESVGEFKSFPRC